MVVKDRGNWWFWIFGKRNVLVDEGRENWWIWVFGKRYVSVDEGRGDWWIWILLLNDVAIMIWRRWMFW